MALTSVNWLCLARHSRVRSDAARRFFAKSELVIAERNERSRKKGESPVALHRLPSLARNWLRFTRWPQVGRASPLADWLCLVRSGRARWPERPKLALFGALAAGSPSASGNSQVGGLKWEDPEDFCALSTCHFQLETPSGIRFVCTTGYRLLTTDYHLSRLTIQQPGKPGE
jgi:hypothetical protein